MLSYKQDELALYIRSANYMAKKDGLLDHPFKMNVLSQIQNRICIITYFAKDFNHFERFCLFRVKYKGG